MAIYLRSALILSISIGIFWPFHAASAADSAQPATKDLAIAMPHNMPGLLGASTPLDEGKQLFPAAWYQAVLDAYADTVVGDALQRENRFADWKLVTLRVAPCEPIGVIASRDIDRLCWPELRLVWQPVLKNFVRFGRQIEAFADDRAIHVGYPLAPELGLSPTAAAQARRLLAKAESARAKAKPPLEVLTQEELALLDQLRRPLVKQLLSATLALRSPNSDPGTYQTMGLRPEAFDGKVAQADFLKRLRGFLSLYARPNNMETLTSFSLVEGRDPPQLDEWVFIAFSGSESGIQQQRIPLHSARDGRAIGPAPLSQHSTMSTDDESFDASSFSSSDWLEIQSLVLLDPSRPENMQPLITDRQKVLIRNTSCASCHKLNSQRFDFHSFSFLEDQELSVSPRVVRDVELDLQWIKKNL